MKILVIIIVVSIVLAAVGFTVYRFWPKKNEEVKVESPKIEYSQIKIGSAEIKAEVVDNESTRMKGLSGREGLAGGEGMLFVFEKSDIYPFWMKDMKFAIDIIWIKDNRIVDIVESAEPPSTAQKIMNYTPRAESDLVLETNAGFCEENNVKIGDEVQVSK